MYPTLDKFHFFAKLVMLNLIRRLMSCFSNYIVASILPTWTFINRIMCHHRDSTSTTTFFQTGETNLMRSIHYFEGNVEIIRMGMISDGYKEQLTRQLDTIVERTQDFTDSAYTSHDRRQHIIVLCERAKMDLMHLLRAMGGSSGSSSDASGVPSAPMLIDLPPPSPRRVEVDQAMRILLKTTSDLKSVLQRTALELAGSLVQTCRRRTGDLLDALADAALSADVERLQESML